MAFKFFCVILQLRLLLLDDEHGEEKQEGEGGDGPDNDWKDQSVHLRAKCLVSLLKSGCFDFHSDKQDTKILNFNARNF